jgi:hypothetical protein
MTNAIFEDISGNELINTQNQNFLVNTSDSNILNINNIVQEYSSQALFNSSNAYLNYFSKFEINLLNKIPKIGNGNSGNNVYFSNKTIYLEFVNLASDEEIEIEFISATKPIGDIIV